MLKMVLQKEGFEKDTTFKIVQGVLKRKVDELIREEGCRRARIGCQMADELLFNNGDEITVLKKEFLGMLKDEMNSLSQT